MLLLPLDQLQQWQQQQQQRHHQHHRHQQYMFIFICQDDGGEGDIAVTFVTPKGPSTNTVVDSVCCLGPQKFFSVLLLGPCGYLPIGIYRAYNNIIQTPIFDLDPQTPDPLTPKP